jgi:hypothetical protein
MEELDIGATLAISQEGEELLQCLARDNRELHLKRLRLSDSSFRTVYMVCWPSTVLELARERAVKKLLTTRPYLKMEVFAPDCL